MGSELRGGSAALRAAVADAFGLSARRGHALFVGVTGVDPESADVTAWGGPAYLDRTSLMEIGSVTKTFTGLLLATMTVDGTVTLDRPVASLLPLPQLGGATLLDLATHTSGLPRLPKRTVLAALRSPADPYRGIDRERLLRSVPKPRRAAPAYSNLGAALLGAALETAAGTPYGTLLAERVLAPLKLTRTTLTGTPATTGHRDGKPVPTWTFDAYAPAGGLRASTDDMLRYARAVLDPDHTPLADAIRLATTEHRDFDANNRIGLGWMIGRRSGRRWHNGGTGGAHAWLSCDQQNGLAGFFASTESRQDDSPGVGVLTALTTRPGPPA